jgi:hypothetical protein
MDGCYVVLSRCCNAGQLGLGLLHIWAGNWDLGIASCHGNSYCEGFARIRFMRSAHNILISIRENNLEFTLKFSI